MFNADLHIMMNSRINAFHLWAVLEENNADCWGTEAMPLSTSCFSQVPIVVIICGGKGLFSLTSPGDSPSRG